MLRAIRSKIRLILETIFSIIFGPRLDAALSGCSMAYMREPTEEQKQKAAERRARMRELAGKIRKMTDTERNEFAARLPGVVTIEGHALSPFNTCFVLHQKPDATVVGGFRQWKKAGRFPKPNTALAIWIPCGEKHENPETGEKETGEVEFFGLANVYDVSDTLEKTEKAENEAQ